MVYKPSYIQSLQKARSMPIGAIRHYGNGETFKKVGGTKGWEYIGKTGGTKVKVAEEEARKNGLPISHAEPRRGLDEHTSQSPKGLQRGEKIKPIVLGRPGSYEGSNKMRESHVKDPEGSRIRTSSYDASPAILEKLQSTVMTHSVTTDNAKKTPHPPTDEGLEIESCEDFYKELPTADYKTHALEYFNVKISDKVTEANKKYWVPVMVQLAQLNGLGFKTRLPVRVTFAKRSAGKRIGVEGEREEGGKKFTATAIYNPSSKTIFLGKEYDETFVHEYFHHLDYTLLGYKPAKLHWDEQAAKFKPLEGEKSQSGTKERRAFFDALKNEKVERISFFERCKTKDRERGYKDKPYYSNETEIIARLGEQYFDMMIHDKDWKPVLNDWHNPGKYMSYNELKAFRAAFVKMFNSKEFIKKQGILIKAKLCFGKKSLHLHKSKYVRRYRGSKGA